MADDKRDEATTEATAGEVGIETPATIVGNKSPGTVGELLKKGYETALRNLDKPSKPAKTKYEPFRW